MNQTWSGVDGGLHRDGASAALSWGGVVITSHFQPIYDVRRSTCAGYEALVRATGPSGKPIRPEELCASATREGRALVLDRACRALHLRNFATIDPGAGRLYLNVLPDAAVEDAGLAHEFADLIRYYGLVPRRVCIEILEHNCADENALVDAVAAYREIGAGIAMDDFGVGRSNFDRVAALRPELVKLERCVLVEAMGESRAGAQLASLIDMLQDTGAQVLVEGVESPREALLAVDSGAAFLQGNYLAAPAPRVPGDGMAGKLLQRVTSMRRRGIAAVNAG